MRAAIAVPALLVVASLATLPPLRAEAGATSGASEALSFGDVRAAFFRFTLDAKCLVWEVRHDAPREARLPHFQTEVHGVREADLAGATRDRWQDSFVLFVDDVTQGDHLRVAPTAAGVEIARVAFAAEETPMDSPLASHGGRTAICAADRIRGDEWLAVYCTCVMPNLTVRIGAFETYDFAADAGTPARLELTLATRSNDTFALRARDFDGGVSASGDPHGLGAPPHGVIAGAGTGVDAPAGLVAGFGDILVGPLVVGHARDRVSEFVVDGPAGVERAEDSLFSVGPGGGWRFLVGADVAPSGRAGVYLWGARIDTGGGADALSRSA